MTPEEAYEALLRNGGRAIEDPGLAGHLVCWYFDPETGVLSLVCQCGYSDYCSLFVRPTPDEPDHDLAYDLPTHVDPGVTE